jgi:hypothetical protein
MPRLIIKTKGKTITCNLPKTPITIGSNVKNSICIKDSSIADRHCEITYTTKGYILRFLASESSIHGKKEIILKDKEEIRIGNVVITFEDGFCYEGLSEISRGIPKKAKTNTILYVIIGMLVILGILGYIVLSSRPTLPKEESARKIFLDTMTILEHSDVLIKNPQTRKDGYEMRLSAYEKLVKIVKEYPGTLSSMKSDEIIQKRNLRDWAERENLARAEVPKFIQGLKNLRSEDISGLSTLCASLIEKYRDTSMEDELLMARTRIEDMLSSIKGPTLEDFYKMEDKVKSLIRAYEFQRGREELSKFSSLVKTEEVKKKVLELKDHITTELKRHYELQMEKITLLAGERKFDSAISELKILIQRCKDTEFEKDIQVKIKEFEEKLKEGDK